MDQARALSSRSSLTGTGTVTVKVFSVRASMSSKSNVSFSGLIPEMLTVPLTVTWRVVPSTVNALLPG